MIHDYRQQNYPEFCFIDCAWNGPSNRNNILTIEELERNTLDSMSDCYATIPRYRKDLLDHVQRHSSVKDFKGECYIDYLWFDFDKPLEKALSDASKFLCAMQMNYELDMNFSSIIISLMKESLWVTKLTLKPLFPPLQALERLVIRDFLLEQV